MQAILNTTTNSNAPSAKPARPAPVITETYAATLPSTGYVRVPVVAGVCGVAKSTIWKWCAEGRFPKPVKLSPRVSGWRASDIRAWLGDPAGWADASTER